MEKWSWIAFDCDGVLLDNELDSCRNDSIALERLGVNISAQEIITRFAGCTVEGMLATISDESDFFIEPAEFSKVKSDLGEAEPVAFPGVLDCLELLDKFSIPTCVVSSTQINQLTENLRSSGLIHLFDDRIFSSSMVLEGKPAPDVYLFAARATGFDPGQCIAIEDSANGVTAAKSAGMQVVGFTGGSHCLAGHAEALRGAGASKVFGSWGELTEFLVPEDRA
ncbi:MAG: HAD family phosphatase [Erythrobacter sp.]|nr:HAD family phosphatase [Erythrobacter sp.]